MVRAQSSILGMRRNIDLRNVRQLTAISHAQLIIRGTLHRSELYVSLVLDWSFVFKL